MDLLRNRSMQQDVYAYCHAEKVNFEYVLYSIKKKQRKHRPPNIVALVQNIFTVKTRYCRCVQKIERENNQKIRLSS